MWKHTHASSIFLICFSTFNENNLHLINKLLHLFPRVQWRWIHAHTIQLSSYGVKNGHRWTQTMNRSTPHIVINTNPSLHLATIVNHRVLEHRHYRCSRRWCQTRILYGLALEKVHVSHVWKVLVIVLRDGKCSISPLG